MGRIGSVWKKRHKIMIITEKDNDHDNRSGKAMNIRR